MPDAALKTDLLDSPSFWVAVLVHGRKAHDFALIRRAYGELDRLGVDIRFAGDVWRDRKASQRRAGVPSQELRPAYRCSRCGEPAHDVIGFDPQRRLLFCGPCARRMDEARFQDDGQRYDHDE